MLTKFLKGLGKTLLSGIVFSLVGLASFLIYFFAFWLPANSATMGLSVVILFPVFLLLFSVLGLVLGFIFGVVGYWMYSLIKKISKRN